MPSLADLQNIRVVRNPAANMQSRLQAIQLGNNGGMPQGGYSPQGLQFPQGFGGFNSTNIQNMLAAQNQLSQYQREQDARIAQQNIDNARGFSLSGGYDPGPMRQMTGVESGLKKASDFTQGLVNMTGWDPSKGFTPGNILRFGASLPFQMAQGVTEGSEQLYEAATGRPLLQADSETGLIGTNTLDASQRAASLVNAGINIGGLFTGGSARAIGTGANIVSKGKVGARMAEGMFGRAMKSPAGQIAYDVAEEGGEEFVQQYLDDTRMKQLDEGTFGRALTGAKWGALGGGMMSGTSLAVNKALGRNQAQNESATERADGNTGSEPADMSRAQEIENKYAALRGTGGSARGITSQERYLADLQSGEQRRIPASYTQKMRYRGVQIDRNSANLGVEGIRNSWRSGRDSQAEIARAFRLEGENGQKILEDAILHNTVAGTDYGSLENALNALKRQQFGDDRMVISFGRNPDTKNGGFNLQVENFVGGDAVEVHPWVAGIIGSDYDGDTGTIYLNTDRTNFLGFPTEMLRDPEAYEGSAAASESDWAFGYVDKNLHKDKSKIRRTLEAALQMYDTNVTSRIDEWVDRIAEASERGEKGESNYSTIFNEIGTAVSESTQDEWAGRNAVSEILDGIESDTEARVYAYFQSIDEAREAAKKLYEQEVERLGENNRSWITYRGNLGGTTKFMQVVEFMAGISYAITGKGNPIFRQYSLFNFNAMDHDAWITSLNEFSEMSRVEDVFDTLVRVSFRMAAAGESPITAAEGIIESAIFAETFVKLGPDFRIKSSKDVDTLIETYKEAHDNYVDIYNNAIKEYTTAGLEIPANEFLQHKFSDKDVDEHLLYRSLVRSFGNVPISYLFDVRFMPERYHGMTLLGFISTEINSEDETIRSLMKMQDPGVLSFVTRLMGAKKNLKKGLFKSIRDVIGNSLVDKLMVHVKYDDNGVPFFDYQYQGAFFDYIDSISQIITPKIAVLAGLYDQTILRTELGQMLLDKNASVRTNAIIGISLRTQFLEVMTLMQEGEINRANKKLKTIAKVSPFHAIIAQQFMSDGHSPMLDFFTDPSKDLSEKEHAIELMKAGAGGISEEFEIFDLLLTEESDFALSGFSNRVRGAKSSITIAERNLHENDIADAKDLRLLSDSKGADAKHLIPWVKSLATRVTMKIDLGLLGAEIYSAGSIHNYMKEKGTNVEAAVQAHASMQIAIKGGPLSYVNDIMARPNDVIDLDDFASNKQLIMMLFADENFRIRLTDPETGENTYLSIGTLIEAATGGRDTSGKLNNENFFAILDCWPQIGGWLTEGAVQPTVSENGQPGASVAKSKSLTESFKDYLNDISGTKDTGFDRQVQDIYEFISMKLLNQSWYKPALVAMIEDLDTKISSIRDINYAAKEVHERVVKGILARLINGDESTDIGTNHVLDVAQEIIDNARRLMSLSVDTLRRSAVPAHTKSDLLYIYGESVANTAFLSSVSKILSNHGINSDSTTGSVFGSMVHLGDVSGEINELVDLMTGIQQAAAYSIQADLDRFSTKPSETIVEEQIRLFDSNPAFRKQLNRKEREAIKAEIRAAGEVTHRIADIDVELSSIVIPGSINELVENENGERTLTKTGLELRESLIQHVIKIKEKTGTIPEIDPETGEIFEAREIDEILSGSSIEEIADSLSKFREKWNDIYFTSMLKELSSRSGVHINSNAFRAGKEYVSNLDDFCSSIEQEILAAFGLTDLKTPAWSKKEQYTSPKIPVPNFTSSTAEGVGNALKNMDQSAFVPQTVSINGGMTKLMEGFGLLSRNTMSPIPPTPITVEQLEEMSRWNNRYKVALRRDGEEISYEDLRTPAGALRDYNAMEPEEQLLYEIVFYDPENNPHGIYDSNTPFAHSLNPQRYKRLPGIISRIIDFSQEGMVLKAKKAIKSAALIVAEGRKSYHSGNSFAEIDSFQDTNAAFVAMQQTLRDYRLEFRHGLVNEFTNNSLAAKNLGFDDEQAMILAQGLTPGFVITYLEEDGKTVKQAVLDASYLFMEDSQAFSARLLEICGGDLSRIQSAEVLAVTPEEASMRILRAVSDLRHSGDDITEDQYLEAADNAMNNWDNYVIGNLSVDKIMSRIRSIGYSRKAKYTALDWRTPAQYVIEELYGGNSKAYDSRAERGDFGEGTHRISDDSSEVKSGIEISKAVFGSFEGVQRNPAVFTRTLLPRNLSRYKNGVFSNLNHDISHLLRTNMQGEKEDLVSKTKDGKTKVYPRNAVLCLDEDQVGDALLWASKTGGVAFIEESDWNRVQSRFNGYEVKGKIRTEERYGLTFVMINPVTDEARLREIETGVDAPDLVLDPSQIYAAYTDYNDHYKLGDASALATYAMASYDEDVYGHREYDLSKLFGKKYVSGDTVGVADAETVINMLQEGRRRGRPNKRIRRSALEPQGRDITENAFENDLEVFLNRLRNNDQDGKALLSSGVSSGEIIAILHDGTSFIPIYLPDSCPNDIVCTAVQVDERNSTVHIHYGGKATWDDFDAWRKMSLAGEAMKMIVSFDPSIEVPTIIGRDDKETFPVHLIVPGGTEDGRIDGMEDNVRIKDIWYCFKKFGGSLLFEPDKTTGKYKWRDHIPEHYREGLLSRHMTNAWRDVESGQLQLVVPGNGISARQAAIANMAIKRIVSNCRKYGIDPHAVFSTYTIENGERINNRSDTRYMMVFEDMRYTDIVQVFHAIDPNFIQAPDDINVEGPLNTIMDAWGRTRVEVPGQGTMYAPVRWGRHQIIGDESSTYSSSGVAKYSPQHVYRRGLDYGFTGNSQWKDALDWADYILGRTEYVKVMTDNEFHRGLAKDDSDEIEDVIKMEGIIDGTYSGLKHALRIAEIKRNRLSVRRVYEKNGNEEVVINEPWKDHRISTILSKLKRTGENEPGLNDWTWQMFMTIIVDRINGYTKTDEEHHKIDINTVAQCLEQFYNDLTSDERVVPIRNKITNGQTASGRYALSCLSHDEIDYLWESKLIQRKWGTKQNFIDAMLKQAESDFEQTEFITDERQRKACVTAWQADFDGWGMYGKTKYVANSIWLDDIAKKDDALIEIFGKRGVGYTEVDIDPDVYNELCTRQLQLIGDFIEKANKTNRAGWVRVSNDESGRKVLAYKAQDGRVVAALLDTLTETSKVQALLNPAVFASNLLDRGFHQSMMHFALWLGNRLRLGPYASKNPPRPENIEIAVNNEFALELYSAIRLARLVGEEIEFLAGMNSADDIRAWKKERMEKMSRAQRARAKIYDLQTGSDKLIKGQFRNFLYRFYQFAEVTPGQEFWVAKSGDDDISYFEHHITEDRGAGAAKFMVEILGGHNSNTPSLTIALQAMNSAQQGDMAQRNVFGMVLQEICRKSPLSKFIVTTCISRFPDYSLNVTSRMLNWILPMSSINYVITERLAEYGHNKAERTKNAEGDKRYVDPHYEIAQVHRNLKEAMLVDITHLGVGAVTMILLGMSGGIEPPDDEKKWGNTDEWLIFGMRVGDAWWLEDILGIALPMAAFSKSVQLGKPRMDILVNGTVNACCSNPMIKVADAVGWIADPDGSLISRYDRDYELYKNAKGGPPSITDWAQANSIGFGLNWVSQFFTPSFLREWYQNSQQWERSYKRVYQTNPDGSLSELGQQGYTEYTTYADAQIRRATRRNPILGFFADMFLHPTTGYMAGEMPMTVYTDDYQRESGEYWSINGLSPTEQQAKILEIICEIQSYDNMDDLIASGFYLDNETRAALGSTVWDIVNEWDNWYYGLQEDGWFDYYTLGNGDFQAGQQMAASIKSEWINQKKAWSDFYYKKVRELPNSIAKYNRYNTTYEKDVYGEVYASGYRPQGVLPFVSAPGTTTSPEGTAGYENDFMSVSSVTGLPLNQRALIPTEAGGEAMPALEAFSGDGNGSGYSQLYNSWYGSDGTTNEGGSLPSDLANNGLPGSNIGTPTVKNSTPQASGSSKKSSSRSRGGGGGYRRRGGGGGGGGYSSTPNIYARYQAPYAVSANVMGRVNRSRSNFDYLRPSWETKGSREAYKREDI